MKSEDFELPSRGDLKMVKDFLRRSMAGKFAEPARRASVARALLEGGVPPRLLMNFTAQIRYGGPQRELIDELALEFLRPHYSIKRETGKSWLEHYLIGLSR